MIQLFYIFISFLNSQGKVSFTEVGNREGLIEIRQLKGNHYLFYIIFDYKLETYLMHSSKMRGGGDRRALMTELCQSMCVLKYEKRNFSERI